MGKASKYFTLLGGQINWESSVLTISDLPMNDPTGTARFVLKDSGSWIKHDGFWKLLSTQSEDQYLIQTTLFGKDLYGE